MSENCRKCVGRLVAAKLQALTNMARLARFERATAWFVARYSIQLSYRRVEGRYYRDVTGLSQACDGTCKTGGFTSQPTDLVRLYPS